MNRAFLRLFAAIAFTAAPLAKGSAYNASILYPLTVPTGFSTISPYPVLPGQTVGSASLVGNIADYHAIRWTAAGPVDFNPTNLPGITLSEADDASGNQQVGYGLGSGTGNNQHAMLWAGSASSVVDLNPTDLNGITTSGLNNTDGSQQVGEGSGSGTGNHNHAMLWNGTAASAVDLHPTNLPGITNSTASATDSSQQVGQGYGDGDFPKTHALLWTGTAASVVDLNPTNLSGINYSIANGVAGNQQVGEGQDVPFDLGGLFHALLWTGTAASAVDLNPSSLVRSDALATNGYQQVGYDFNVETDSQAMVWTSTAASAIDLAEFLPPNSNWGGSEADYIDSAGNIFGSTDGTYNGLTGTFAVEWSPVPEPAMGALLLMTGAGMLMRRRQGQLA